METTKETRYYTTPSGWDCPVSVYYYTTASGRGKVRAVAYGGSRRSVNYNHEKTQEENFNAAFAALVPVLDDLYSDDRV